MKKRSKIVALLLTLVMITSVLTVAPFTASAYVNHTQAEALAWVQSQSGHRVWNGQCAGFINGYYDYLVGYAASGDAKDYQWNSLPEGWYRTNIPTPGDIVVWGAGAYMGESGHYANATHGHVGIVYAVNGGSMDYYDQNSGEYGETVGIHYGHDVSSASTFIHPDFTANLKSDFYAYIINVNTWLLATNNDNWNITANQETGNANQVWHFERLSNGSYKITSCKDNRCMEVHNFESANGTNVHVNEYTDNSAQHWYISGESAKYVFKAECGNNVLDLSGGTEAATSGTNIQMWEYNGTAAQLFQIWELETPNIGTPVLNVSDYHGENGENVLLNWNTCTDASGGYDVRIYDEGGSIIKFIHVSGTSLALKLPIGKYKADVAAINKLFNWWKFGSRVSFSCNPQKGDVNLDGNINIKDVTAIQRHLADLGAFSKEQLAAADTNGDGKVDINDATHLQRYLAEFDVQLG